MEKLTKTQLYLGKALEEELEYYQKRIDQLKSIMQNVKNHNSLEEFIKKAKIIDTFDDSWIEDIVESGKSSNEIVEDDWKNGELLITNEPYLYDIYDDQDGNLGYAKCFINSDDLYHLQQEFQDLLNKDLIERKCDGGEDEFVEWLRTKGYQVEIIERPGDTIHIESVEDRILSHMPTYTAE
ncbi:hypothetical protein MZM54_02740 [[Brevibacterium] frigoritolerans]|nr:hypothetical protein [Peribacillus frigoritolerans]